MEYNKPPLTVEEQAKLLIKRGLSGNLELIMSRLAAVNYYRLSGYWYPFRNPDDSFKPGTTFDNVWELYVFDRHLRLLVMDAIERIEISVRSQLAYNHSHTYGSFGYATQKAALPKFDDCRYNDCIRHVQEETLRSKETFVDHFRQKYGDYHEMLPVWMAAEVMSFGTILTFYRGSSHKVKQAVANVYKVPERVFDSWLLALNTVRNICAHHGRLWNRASGIKPLIPFQEEYPEWHQPV